jgi:poly-gamma-glutamate synthesis protein (capsule biosynthesis protein)
VSIHWGGNWGYEVPSGQRELARALIESGSVDIVHGHSSHHPKGIEVYRERLILYGCGDFLNDYEGIKGYEEYRDDLALMYFCDIDLVSGDIAALEIVPLQIRKFQLINPSSRDVDWMRDTLDRESRRFGSAVVSRSVGRLALSWPKQGTRANTLVP